jgi:hypothetical protein
MLTGRRLAFFPAAGKDSTATPALAHDVPFGPDNGLPLSCPTAFRIFCHPAANLIPNFRPFTCLFSVS